VLITDISGPGDVLGLSAVVSGSRYEGSAQTLDACRLVFVNREDFLLLLDEQPGAWMHATRQLSRNYRTAHRQASVLGLSSTAAAKLASVLLERAALHGTGPRAESKSDSRSRTKNSANSSAPRARP
jgi:CRP/FNR family transcriptional regulator